LKYSSVTGLFNGPHIESILLLSAGRTKGIRGPHAARGPHFAHPWSTCSHRLYAPAWATLNMATAHCDSPKIALSVPITAYAVGAYMDCSTKYYRFKGYQTCFRRIGGNCTSDSIQLGMAVNSSLSQLVRTR